MGRLLFLVFLIVPIIEIGIFIAVGQAIGLWPTLAGVVLTALIGSMVIRIQGVSLISEIQRLMAAGALPARQLADGLMLAIAGALLLTPGYFTDLMGFILLVPVIRTLVFEGLKSRISVSAGIGGMNAGPSGPDFRDNNLHSDDASGPREKPNNPNVVDLDNEDWR